jgi:hypothetical protein
MLAMNDVLFQRLSIAFVAPENLPALTGYRLLSRKSARRHRETERSLHNLLKRENGSEQRFGMMAIFD